MWDANLISRVMGRKLNEITLFATRAKIDTENIDQYIDIIVSLGDDIDACDTLLDTDGEAEIELDVLDSPLYLDSLSVSDREDEGIFNSMKSTPQGTVTEDNIGDYVRSLLQDAVESLKTSGVKDDDGISVLKDELASCRARIDDLSQQLDFAKSEAAGQEDRINELLAERDGLIEQLSVVKSENSALKTDLMLVEQKLSVLEPAYEEAISKKEDVPAIEEVKIQTTMEEPVEDVASDDSGSGNYLSEQSIETIGKVRDMKNAKIDQIVGMYLDGTMDENTSDNIVDFLKVDVAICNALLNIDFADKSSVVEGFKTILDVLCNSNDPQNQDEYVATLDADEAMIEHSYNQVINSLQGMMMYMKADLGLE